MNSNQLLISLISLFITACRTTNRGCAETFKIIFKPAVTTINRRIVQHNNFPWDDRHIIPLDTEHPIYTIENRLDSVEQHVSLVERRGVFLDLPTNTANKRIY